MEEIADSVYVETGYEGVNVGVIAADQGLVCIDAPSYPREARHWADQLNRRFPNPIRYLILTDASGDRILNARWLSGRIVTHQLTAERLLSFDKRYPASLIESLAERNPVAAREFAGGPVEKADVSFTGKMTLDLGSHRLRLRHAPGPSPATIWVELPDDQVLFCSDSVALGTHPPLEDANIQIWQSSLEWLRIGGGSSQTLAPGRGPVSTGVEGAATMERYLDLLRRAVRVGASSATRESDLAQVIGELVDFYEYDHLPVAWIEAQVRRAVAAQQG